LIRELILPLAEIFLSLLNISISNCCATGLKYPENHYPVRGQRFLNKTINGNQAKNRCAFYQPVKKADTPCHENKIREMGRIN